MEFFSHEIILNDIKSTEVTRSNLNNVKLVSPKQTLAKSRYLVNKISESPQSELYIQKYDKILLSDKNSHQKYP